MTASEANAEMQGHFRDCRECKAASGNPDDLCAFGIRNYCDYLAALAKEQGCDPREFPTFKKYAGLA